MAYKREHKETQVMITVADVAEFGKIFYEKVGGDAATANRFSLALNGVRNIGHNGGNYDDIIRNAFPVGTPDETIKNIASVSEEIADRHFGEDIKTALRFLTRFGNDPEIADKSFVDAFENGQIGEFIESKGGAQAILAETEGIDPDQAKIEALPDIFGDDDEMPACAMSNDPDAFNGVPEQVGFSIVMQISPEGAANLTYSPEDPVVLPESCAKLSVGR